MIKEAFAAVQRNRRSLLLYVAIIFGLHSVKLLCDYFLGQVAEAEIPPTVEHAYAFVSDIVAAAVYAVAQCTAFARIGREMDRPFWKIEGDGEALRRFFKLWFLLDLAGILLLRIVDGYASELDGESISVVLFFFWIIIAVLLVPFGASVMFYGQVGKEEVLRAATTLIDQLPRTMLVLLMGYVIASIVIGIQMAGILPPWATPSLAILDGFGDCLIFCAVWLICIYHRDEDAEGPDLDF